MKAIIYCRVSDRKQAEGDKYSLEDQEDHGRKFFSSKNIGNVEVIRDTFSGDSRLQDRPGGGKLVDLIESGQVEHLYFKVSDRLFRKASAALTYLDVLEEKGIKVYIDGVQKDFSRTDDKTMYGFQSVMDDAEREKILRRTLVGLKKMRDSGKAYSPNAYGFKRLFNAKGEPRMEVDEVEGPVVENIYKMRADGLSYGEIIKSLNDSGIPTKFGRNHWYIEAILQIIKNPIYIGKVKDSEGAIIDSVVYPRIIDNELWQKVQATSSERAYKVYFRRGANPLVGVLRCSYCNASYYFKEPKGNGKTYRTYNHLRTGTRILDLAKCRKCTTPAPYFREDQIDEPCTHAWLFAFITTEIQDHIYNDLQKKIDLDEAEFKVLSERLESEEKDIAEKKARIRKAIVVEGMSASFFTEDVKQLEETERILFKRKADVERNLLDAKSSYRDLRDHFSKEIVTEFIENPRDVYLKTVQFRVVDKTRIEMWLVKVDRVVLWFNPKNPNFIFLVDPSFSEDVSIDLSYHKIPSLHFLLKNGTPLFEALGQLGFLR